MYSLSTYRSGLKQIVITVLALFSVYSHSAEKPDSRPSISDYAALPSLQSVSVSPSGEMLAFVHVEENKKFIKIFNLKTRAVIAAFDPGEILPTGVYFINDDQLVISVEQSDKRMSGYKGTYDVSNAFIYSVKENKLKQLLRPGEVIYSGQTDLGGIVGISKNGKYAYMPAWARRNGDSGRILYSLVRVSLSQNRTRPTIFEKGYDNSIDYFMDGNDQVIAMERYNEKDNKHSIQVPDGRSWRTIYEDSSPIRQFTISGVSPDRKHLVLITSDEDTDRFSCFTMRLSDGKISEKLFSNSKKDIDYLITDINRIVYGVAYDGLTPSYDFFDKKITKKIAEIQKTFSGNSVTIADYSPDWKHVVIHVSGSLYSGNHYLSSGDKGLIGIASQRPKMKGEYIHQIVEAPFKARDGRIIPNLVTIPYQKQNNLSNLPAILLPHGGPESHDRIEFDWIAQALANEGYIVIQPQFRGSSGFGTDHILAGRGEWGKKMQTDLIDALHSLVDEGVVDKNRVCIAGWSYGGYAALAGGAFNSDYFKCIVSVNGVSDLVRILKTEKKEKNRTFDIYEYWKEVIAKGQLDTDALNSISPVNYAGSFKSPVLLVYGDEDETVLPEQSKYMYKALKKSNKDVRLLKIRDEGHSFEHVDNREKALSEIINFINKHI